MKEASSYLDMYDRFDEEQVCIPMSCAEMTDWVDVYDQQGDIIEEIMDHFKQGVKKQPWRTIRTERLAKILVDYARDRFVRDENGVIEIAQQIMDNTAKLHVNTVLCGHDTLSPVQYIKEFYGEVFDEASFEEFTEEYFWDDDTGGWRISDYALGELWTVCCNMTRCRSSEELLSQISIALNICHQRSDLSAWLVEGGQSKLEKLSNL